MEEIKGIIVNSIDYKEKDKLLDIFTPNGKILVIAKGVRSQKAKLKGYTNLMTFGTFMYNPGHNNVLSGADIIDTFFPSWSDPAKNASICLCLELVNRTTFLQEDTSKEFVNLIKAMKEITYGDIYAPAVALKFIVFIANQVGVDYTIAEAKAPKMYKIINTINSQELELLGELDYSVYDIKDAIRYLINLFSTTLNIHFNTLKIILSV